MTNKLPQGWVECKMKDVLEFSQGIQVDVNLQQDSKISDEYIRFLRIVDFTQKTEPPRYVLNPPTHVIVTNDDISMVRYGAAGFVCTGLNGAIANNLFRIIPKENIFNNRFLYYFLIGDSFQNYIKHKQTGTTMQAISFKIMNEADIVVPPLNEQKRIVEKIEEEFGKIDEGVEKLKLAQEQIKQYRKSVLTKFYNIKANNQTNLGSCFEIVNGDRGKNYPAKNKLHKEGIPFVSAINISNGKLREDNLCCLSDEQYDLLGSGKINKGDTLLCIRGSIGKHCRYNKEKGAIASSMVIIRQSNVDIQNEYLHYYIDSPYFYNEVKKYDNGTAQPNLSATDLKKFLYPNIKIDEQKQIVKEVEKRFEVADEVERVITENLEKAEQLKQSILKKAFEGRLVPQDPTDEPASVLLDKIKAERDK